MSLFREKREILVELLFLTKNSSTSTRSIELDDVRGAQLNSSGVFLYVAFILSPQA